MRRALFGSIIGAALATAIGLLAQITQPSSVQVGRCELRATLTSGTAVTTADVTAATSIYVTPKDGGQCSFYDGSAAWVQLSSIAEVTVSVPATTSTLFDIFCYNNAGTIACETLNWTNDTTRATALAIQNGVPVKSGATTRRYIATSRTTTVSGQTEDSLAKRYLSNYYNRESRLMRVFEATASWGYNTATWRQANGAPANQLDFVVGVADRVVSATVNGFGTGTASGIMAVSIGLDSTTAPTSGVSGIGSVMVSGNQGTAAIATLDAYIAVGRHTLVWLEQSPGGSTITWGGVTSTTLQAGITGRIPG